MTRRVLCFGNLLHGDDGIGPCIAQALHRRRLPDDVEVFDLGTDGLALPTLLNDCAEAILVDAWRGDGSAGQVTVRSTDEISRLETEGAISHRADLGFALRAARVERSKLPPIHLVTITIAEAATFHIGLSSAVARATPRAVAKIIRLLCSGARA